MKKITLLSASAGIWPNNYFYDPVVYESCILRRSRHDEVEAACVMLGSMLESFMRQEIPRVKRACFQTTVCYFFNRYLKDHPGKPENPDEKIREILDAIDDWSYIDRDISDIWDIYDYEEERKTANYVAGYANYQNLSGDILDAISSRLSSAEDPTAELSNILGRLPVDAVMCDYIDKSARTGRYDERIFNVSRHKFWHDYPHTLNDLVDRTVNPPVHVYNDETLDSEDMQNTSACYRANEQFIQSQSQFMENLFGSEFFAEKFYTLAEKVFKDMTDTEFQLDDYCSTAHSVFHDKVLSRFGDIFDDYAAAFDVTCQEQFGEINGCFSKLSMLVLFWIGVMNLSEKNNFHALVRQLSRIEPYFRCMPSTRGLNASLTYFDNIATDDLVTMRQVTGRRSDGIYFCDISPWEPDTLFAVYTRIVDRYFGIFRMFSYTDIVNVDFMSLSRYIKAPYAFKYDLSCAIYDPDNPVYSKDCLISAAGSYNLIYRHFDAVSSVAVSAIYGSIEGCVANLVKDSALREQIINNVKTSPLVIENISCVSRYLEQIKNLSVFNYENRQLDANNLYLNHNLSVYYTTPNIGTHNRSQLIHEILSSQLSTFIQHMQTYVYKTADFAGEYIENIGDFAVSSVKMLSCDIARDAYDKYIFDYTFNQYDTAIFNSQATYQDCGTNIPDYIKKNNYIRGYTDPAESSIRYNDIYLDYVKENIKQKNIGSDYRLSCNHLIFREYKKSIITSLQSKRKLKIIYISNLTKTVDNDTKTDSYNAFSAVIQHIRGKYQADQVEYSVYNHCPSDKILKDIQHSSHYFALLLIIDVHGAPPLITQGYNYYVIGNDLLPDAHINLAVALYDDWFLDTIKNSPNVIVYNGACFSGGLANKGTGKCTEISHNNIKRNFILQYADDTDSSAYSVQTGMSVFMINRLLYYHSKNYRHMTSYNSIRADIKQLYSSVRQHFIDELRKLTIRLFNKLFNKNYTSISQIINDVDNLPQTYEEYENYPGNFADVITKQFYDIMVFNRSSNTCFVKQQLSSIETGCFDFKYQWCNPDDPYYNSYYIYIVYTRLYPLHFINALTLFAPAKHRTDEMFYHKYTRDTILGIMDPIYLRLDSNDDYLEVFKSSYQIFDEKIKKQLSIGQMIYDFYASNMNYICNTLNIDNVMHITKYYDYFKVSDADQIYKFKSNNWITFMFQIIMIQSMHDNPELRLIDGDNSMMTRQFDEFML